MIHEGLLVLFPDYKPGDWRLADESDGNGPYVAQWNRAETQPTKEAILAAAAIYVYVPQTVPMRKAKALLIDRDKFDLVDATIRAMSGKPGKIALNEWLTSQEVERYRPLTLAMFSVIGVNDDAEQNQWFIDANSLE